MSKVQMLRCLVNQRLTAAAEEIFGLFERTIAEYEEELSRSKEENERQLRAVLIPQLRLHRADVQQLLVDKEEVPPEQQESSLDQEDPEPPHIKEEQEDPEPPHIKDTDEKTGDSSDTDDSDDWKETRPGCSADVQQLLVDKEEVPPEHQESSLDQEDPEPPHIKA
ncbi:uncharacterized protein PEZ65_011979 [Lycodopsis pacificus]